MVRRFISRKLVFAAAVSVILAAILAFRAAGNWLVTADPLQPARAIVVLGGHVPFRAMEAAAVYKQGWAPEVWLTRGGFNAEEMAFEELGIDRTAEDVYSHRVLERLGVPPAAIRTLPERNAITADEVRAVARRLQVEGGDRVDHRHLEEPYPPSQGSLAQAGGQPSRSPGTVCHRRSIRRGALVAQQHRRTVGHARVVRHAERMGRIPGRIDPLTDKISSYRPLFYRPARLRFGVQPLAFTAGITHLPIQSSTIRTLRRFAAAAIAIAPRKAAETAFVTLVLSATEGIGLLLLVPLLQLVGVDAQQGALTRIVEAFAAAFRAVGLRPTLATVLGLYVAIVWLQGLLQRRQTVLGADVQQEIMASFRNRLYRAIAGMRWIDFARARASDYSQLLTNEVDRVGTAAYYLIDLLVTAAVSLVYVGLAFRVSPAMTAFTLACGAMLALTMRVTIGRARTTGENLSASWTRLYAALSDHLGSLKIARGYGAERRHTETFERLSAELSEVGLVNIRSVCATEAAVVAGIGGGAGRDLSTCLTPCWRYRQRSCYCCCSCLPAWSLA